MYSIQKIKAKLIMSLVILGFALEQQAFSQMQLYNNQNIRDTTGIKTRSVEGTGAFGSDSVTYNKSGLSLQGWNETYYGNGKLLSLGYYVNGKVTTSKTFFESGACQRLVENPDPQHLTVTVFFENGNVRRRINYYNEKPQKVYDFFENGQPEYLEENEKDMKYLIVRKSWYANGNPEKELKLTDKKSRKYEQKNYYATGRLKEEGVIILLSGTQDYVRNGTWSFYDENGKNKQIEKYSYGIKLNSKQ